MAAEFTVQGVSVCVSVSGYTRVCVGMYVSVSMSVCAYACLCVCWYVCECVYVNMSVCAHACLCVCVGMYVSVVHVNTSVCACVCVKEWGRNVTFVCRQYCLLRGAGSPVLGQGTCRGLGLHRQLRLAKTMNRAESLQEKR